MRVGISLGTAYRSGDADGAASVIRQARAAREANLDTLSVGDHHATGPMPYLQNVPTLGRLLAEWDDRPAGCLFLVPLWHPVLMAEQIGTLADIAAGPFIVQTGLGGGSGQFQAMGVPRVGRVSRLEEGITLVRGLLRGETVSSALFGFEGAQIAPLPTRGTEWWVGGGTPEAIDPGGPARRLLVRKCRSDRDLSPGVDRNLSRGMCSARVRAVSDPNSKGCVHRRDGCRCRKVGRCADEWRISRI